MEKITKYFKGKIWWKTLLFTGFIVFFTMLPFIFELVQYSFHNKTIDHYSKGQFFSFGISLLASSVLAYLSLSNFKDTLKIGANVVSIVLMFFLAICYSILVVSPDKSNSNTVFWWSIVLFFISLLQFYHSQYLLNKVAPDVGEVRREESNNIAGKLN